MSGRGNGGAAIAISNSDNVAFCRTVVEENPDQGINIVESSNVTFSDLSALANNLDYGVQLH